MNINFDNIYQIVWSNLLLDKIEIKTKKVLAITSSIIFSLLIIGIIFLIIMPLVHFQNSFNIFLGIGIGFILLGLFLGLPVSIVLNQITKNKIIDFYKKNYSEIIKNTINELESLELLSTNLSNQWILKIKNDRHNLELKIIDQNVYLKTKQLSWTTNLMKYQKIEWNQSKIIRSKLNYCFAAKQFLAKTIATNLMENLNHIFKHLKEHEKNN